MSAADCVVRLDGENGGSLGVGNCAGKGLWLDACALTAVRATEDGDTGYSLAYKLALSPLPVVSCLVDTEVLETGAAGGGGVHAPPACALDSGKADGRCSELAAPCSALLLAS